MPGTFKDNGKTITGEKYIAEGFNTYFASIGTDMANSLPTVDGYEEYLRPNTHSLFHLQAVRREEVVKIMKNQKPKLSFGLDTINNKLVKIYHEELSEPMTTTINKSMESNYVPSLFKIARIIPLYKKNSANEFGNYRPVSLLSALSKILEKVVCQQMMKFFRDNDLLSKTQYGFRAKSQTTHVIQKMLNYVNEHAAKGQPIIATFIDLSKTFDCLQYDKLYGKMLYLGFAQETINWFKSYLSNRTQVAEVNGKVSGQEDMLLGVPQGSIFLFLIYMSLTSIEQAQSGNSLSSQMIPPSLQLVVIYRKLLPE